MTTDSTATDQLLITAVHQRDVLMEAIHKTAIAIGLCNTDVPPTGPHLLMFCDDFTNIINDQTKEIETLKTKLAALQPDGDTGE